jgi:hypothetical protein
LLIFDAPSQNFDMTDVKVEWEKSHPQIWWSLSPKRDTSQRGPTGRGERRRTIADELSASLICTTGRLSETESFNSSSPDRTFCYPSLGCQVILTIIINSRFWWSSSAQIIWLTSSIKIHLCHICNWS